MTPDNFPILIRRGRTFSKSFLWRDKATLESMIMHGAQVFGTIRDEGGGALENFTCTVEQEVGRVLFSLTPAQTSNLVENMKALVPYRYDIVIYQNGGSEVRNLLAGPCRVADAVTNVYEFIEPL